MATGQAFAVAFGLAFVVLGGLYVIARSGREAERHRENPDAVHSTLWLGVDRGFTILFVGMALCLGTWFLIHRRPNVFIAAGMATWFYAHALKHTFVYKPSMFRIASAGYALAGLLCGVGFALQGGPVGIIGVVLSLLWATFWLWISKAFWRVGEGS